MKDPDNQWQQTNKKNTINLLKWTIVWLITLSLARFGHEFIWSGNHTFTLIAIVLNLIVGIGMLFANRKHLNGLDEMQQKIQLDAMALTLGVGLIASMIYSLLDITNMISTDVEISNLVILMAITYFIGVLLGQRRYG